MPSGVSGQNLCSPIIPRINKIALNNCGYRKAVWLPSIPPNGPQPMGVSAYFGVRCIAFKN